MNNLPPLNDLKVFCEVAKHSSFAATAESLDVSPAFISKRIRLLEQHFGVHLFYRSPRRSQLTHQGRIVLMQAEKMLELLSQTHDQLTGSQDELKGCLRIVTSSGFGEKCIAPILSRLFDQNPHLELELSLLDRRVDLLSEGYDLEIKVGGDLPERMIAEKLLDNHRVLCASPDYLAKNGDPKTLSDLGDHSCISIRERDHDYHSQWQLYDESTQRQSIRPKLSLKTNKGEVAVQWALAGHGIILRSLWSAQPYLNRGQLVRVLPDFFQPADIYAIYAQRKSTSAILRYCVKTITSMLREPLILTSL